MMQRQIRLKLDEVKDFVITASRCDFDIDVSYNRFTVDAKSIVGVLGLDLNRPLTVAYNGYNLEFEKMMNRLALAC
ncbi:HPr family phosphocarrier protein [Parablautia intestinalis]|jgi:phosphocarrier protein HPr|uniref:HPr family phosphocarrier protein n=1 Tax=Parablautia intestinalis TaxID=2320100 RepID=A0A3A9AQQ9_9FIRM|nr:HPr family phosphocarrier protein [Parablautia intestinalis]MCI8614658.1 HPr family phosphocarrier protein [Lachnospiraceae bacterium]MDE7047448.1 HPr family phosphocarrier protein [Lachnospiraceae bacterium]RKI89921.1 HPr family phosphocarrier protein [Parablautia intestinalis]